MRSDGEIQTSVQERESECALQRHFLFTSQEKDFFYIHGVITSQEKEKRSVLYYSDISDMFPVTGGNFIHTCMHVHIVFAGVRVCVRAGRRVCVCVKQIHTHSSRVFAGLTVDADCGAWRATTEADNRSFSCTCAQ